MNIIIAICEGLEGRESKREGPCPQRAQPVRKRSHVTIKMADM